MAHRSVVTLQGLDRSAIQQQLDLLKNMQRQVASDDSAEAATLADTVKLLTQIERALSAQNRIMH